MNRYALNLNGCRLDGKGGDGDGLIVIRWVID
jgi:hypothetical protein